MDDSVLFATIGELSARLRKREFSAVELTRAFSDRLEKLGPRYTALALLLRESAVRQAIPSDVRPVVDSALSRLHQDGSALVKRHATSGTTAESLNLQAERAELLVRSPLRGHSHATR